MLGFAGCFKIDEEEHIIYEYGVPPVKYTVKGAVVNKATKKPIEGIRVGYGSSWVGPVPMYGTFPTTYTPKAHVLTNSKGEFKLTDSSNNMEFQIVENQPISLFSVYVEDIDGEENGMFQSEHLHVDINNATYDWQEGAHTVTMNIELNEIEKE